MSVVICPNCGNDMNDFVYCPKCGTLNPNTMIIEGDNVTLTIEPEDYDPHAPEGTKLLQIDICPGRRNHFTVARLYTALFEELGTYDKMHSPLTSAAAMAEVDLLYTEGYSEPNIKRNFEVCFPAPEGVSRSQIIEIKNMRYFTRCEHHGLPFFGFANYAYVPDELIIGLSKPARVVQHYSHRYQMQEQLAQQIGDYLWETLKPVAHVVVLEGVHLCATMRGVRTPDEVVRVREEKVNEQLYHEQEREGHLYHIIKDLLAMSLKSDIAPVRLM